MSLIQKSDLKYDYDWSSTAANKPRTFSTESDANTELFSVNEGEEILSFINEYADLHQIASKSEALRIENLLHDKLQREDMTRDEAREWLDDYMKSKKN